MRFSKAIFLCVGVLTLQASASPVPESRAIIRPVDIFEADTPTTPTRTTDMSNTLACDPTLPSANSGSELPAPAASLSLRYVALGRGTQNYSCAAASAVPTAIGAVAVLFDITELAWARSNLINDITSKAVYIPFNPMTSASFFIPGVPNLVYLGHHYFSAAGVPTFNLSAVGDILYSTKTASVAAPSTANAGPDGTGAVVWLQLQDKGGSVGLSEVYRVETAGGNPYATCAAAGLMTVDYAAQYWFYD